MTSPIAGEREAEAAITPDNPVECTTCGALVVGVAPLSGVAADGRLGVAVSLLTECLGPLEVAAAVIESEDGNEAIETLIAQVRKFCADAKVAALLEPVGEGALLEQARIALGLMLSYHGQGNSDYADVAQVKAQEAYDAIEDAIAASPKTNGGMGS